MSLSLAVQRITGRRGPQHALVFDCNGRWTGWDHAFLHSLDGRLLFRNDVICDLVVAERVAWVQGNRAHLGRDQYVGVTLAAPLTPAAISYIEERRNADDVLLQLEFRYRWQEGQPQQDENIAAGRVFWDAGVAQLQPIPRSEWIKRLAEMQWSEIALFEVPLLPLHNDKYLTESIEILQDAQSALRAGDHRGVLAKCRQAFESAGKYVAQGDNIRQGFASLFAKAFPETPAKQEGLNNYVTDLSEYAHLGRHAQYPALHITRAEATFIFAGTVAFFSLIGQQLATQGNQDKTTR